MFSKSIYGFSLLESEKSLSIFRSIIMMMACDIFFILEFIFSSTTLFLIQHLIFIQVKNVVSAVQHISKLLTARKENQLFLDRDIANIVYFTDGDGNNSFFI